MIVGPDAMPPPRVSIGPPGPPGGTPPGTATPVTTICANALAGRPLGRVSVAVTVIVCTCPPPGLRTANDTGDVGDLVPFGTTTVAGTVTVPGVPPDTDSAMVVSASAL